MSIKFEILAEDPQHLFVQLRDLLAGDPGPALFEAIEETTTVVAPPEAVTPDAEDPEGDQSSSGRGKLPARREGQGRGEEDRKARRTAASNPLPENDDPLADDLPFDPPVPSDMTPEQVIAAAVSKLRDLHAKPAGQAAIRALREKYQIQFLHEVPAGRADELMADALRIEKEISA